MTRLTGDTAGISVIIKIKISINNDNNSDNCNCWAVVEKIMLKVSNIKLLQQDEMKNKGCHLLV